MSRLDRVNARLNKAGTWTTAIVGTMPTAIVFFLFALAATPGILPAALTAIFVWLCQVVFQLVLLPVIMVGQNAQATKAEEIAARQLAAAAAREERMLGLMVTNHGEMLALLAKLGIDVDDLEADTAAAGDAAAEDRVRQVARDEMARLLTTREPAGRKP